MASAGNGRRVLIIVQNLPVPFDRRVWLEATSLTAAGYAVSVICPKAKGYNESFERLEGVDIYRYGLPIDAQGALGFVMEFAWCFLRTFMKSVRIAVAGRGFDVIRIPHGDVAGLTVRRDDRSDVAAVRRHGNRVNGRLPRERFRRGRLLRRCRADRTERKYYGYRAKREKFHLHEPHCL